MKKYICTFLMLSIALVLIPFAIFSEDNCEHPESHMIRIDSSYCAHVCDICGEQIELHEHDYVARQAIGGEDCSKSGHFTYECMYGCGAYIETDEPYYNVSHSYKDGICTSCGLSKPDEAKNIKVEVIPEIDDLVCRFGDIFTYNVRLLGLDGDDNDPTLGVWEHDLWEIVRLYDQKGSLVYESSLGVPLTGYLNHFVSFAFDSYKLIGGDYLLVEEIYRYENGNPVEMVTASCPIKYYDNNGYYGGGEPISDLKINLTGLEYIQHMFEGICIDGSDMDCNEIRLRYNVKTASENGLPMRAETIRVCLANGDKVIRQDNFTTPESAQISSAFTVREDEFPDGVYTLSAYVVDSPMVKSTVDFDFNLSEILPEPEIHEDPALPVPNVTVSVDKEKYDYYDTIILTVELEYEEGPLEDLDAIVYDGDTGTTYLWAKVTVCFPDGYELVDYPDSLNRIDTGVFSGKINFLKDTPELLSIDKIGECIISVKVAGGIGTASFYYTAEEISCTGEHSFGEWTPSPSVVGHERKCTLCGKLEYGQHAADDETVTLPFYTYDDEGNQTESGCCREFTRCKICDGFIEEVGNHHKGPFTHSFYDGEHASCVSDGYAYSVDICSCCGFATNRTEIYYPSKGHNVVGGVCSVCGIKESNLNCHTEITADKNEVGENELIKVTYTLKDAGGEPVKGWIVSPQILQVIESDDGNTTYIPTGFLQNDSFGSGTETRTADLEYGKYCIIINNYDYRYENIYSDGIASVDIVYSDKSVTPDSPQRVSATVDKDYIIDYSGAGGDIFADPGTLNITCTVTDPDTQKPVAGALVRFELIDPEGKKVYWTDHVLTGADGTCKRSLIGMTTTKFAPGEYNMRVTVSDSYEIKRFIFSEAKIKDGAYVIDASLLESIRIPSDIARSMTSGNSSVEISFADSTLEFDQKAFTAIISQASDDVSVSATMIDQDLLNERQRSALSIEVDYTLISLEVQSGDSLISDFKGGTATVTIPTEWENIPDGTSLTVLHISDDGTATEINSSFVDGAAVFETPHFSTYAVYLKQAANHIEHPTDEPSKEPAKAKKNGCGSTVSPGLVIIITMCLLAAAPVYVKSKKQGRSCLKNDR